MGFPQLEGSHSMSLHQKCNKAPGARLHLAFTLLEAKSIPSHLYGSCQEPVQPLYSRKHKDFCLLISAGANARLKSQLLSSPYQNLEQDWYTRQIWLHLIKQLIVKKFPTEIYAHYLLLQAQPTQHSAVWSVIFILNLEMAIRWWMDRSAVCIAAGMLTKIRGKWLFLNNIIQCLTVQAPHQTISKCSANWQLNW